ncbi:MAG: penicillin-binding protein 2 [Patescibacteria group bacterium]|nr:penicillin-binding protein 2 [Patescibacteria group bacterium]
MKNNPFKIQEGQVKDSKVKDFFVDKKVGDYLNFEFVSRSQNLGKIVSDEKIKKTLIVFFVFIGILFIRASYLQVVRGAYYRDIAEGNRIRTDIITANRGLIYDRFGNLLVRNISYFFLYVDRAVWEKIPEQQAEIMSLVEKTMSLSPGDFQARLDSAAKGEKVLIYENVPYEQAIALIVQTDKYPALRISFEPRRQYLSSGQFSHVLGYLGIANEQDMLDNPEYNYNDRIGRTGIEAIYEKELKGINGKKQAEVDALFNEKNLVSYVEPIPGHDIVLTIDAKAQSKLSEIMEANAKRTGKNKMAAVVLDPNDGSVIAMSSLPFYDNNIFTSILNNDAYAKIIQDPDTPLLNRVVSGEYPMGSVFKLVMSSAALQEKIVDDKFSVLSTGGVNVGGNFFPDWRPSGHGQTDIYWAIADSVNTFFYSVGGGNNQWIQEGLGVDRIIAYAKKFGLGAKTGIDLPSEAAAFLPSKEWKEENIKERWYLGDTYNLSIGQGYLLTTPMQAAQLVSYFANHGKLFVPHIIKEVKSGETSISYEPKVALTNVVDSANLEIIRKALRETVVSGTAQSLKSVSVEVAGKTGTAQFNRNKTPHSWLVAFAPYDQPKVSMAVIVEEGGDTGLAVTVTRQFLEWYFSQ